MTIKEKIQAILKESEDTEHVKEQLIVDVSEDVAALIDGEDLTEEFKTKAATIFEAAVVTRVKAEVAKIEEHFDAKIAEITSDIKDDLIEKVDGYLNYVTEQWMLDNKLAIETGLKTEVVESFMSGMKGLFEEHYIDIPEDKIDILAKLEEDAKSTKDMLDKQLASNVELTRQLNDMKRAATIAEHTANMADTDAEKFSKLVEELEYEDSTTFKTKLQTIKENYFSKKQTPRISTVVTDEPVRLEEDVIVNPAMAGYLKALNK